MKIKTVTIAPYRGMFGLTGQDRAQAGNGVTRPLLLYIRIQANTNPDAMDKQLSAENSTFSNTFLTGAILLANLDFAGLADYALKALIGGAIWLGYKMTADYLERKRKKQ